jgi:hypothetical protein
MDDDLARLLRRAVKAIERFRAKNGKAFSKWMQSIELQRFSNF